jgi:hypothetical protein
VAWLDVPANTLERLEQRYHRLTDSTYDYEASWAMQARIPRLAALARNDRSAALARDDYHAVLETTPEGFARRYPGLWELEG